jgi:hypothetical protein
MSTPGRHSRIGTTFGARKPGLLAAIVVATAAYLGTPMPTSASIVTFTIPDTTLTFGGFGTDTLSGTFSYDTSTLAETAGTFTLTGAVNTGTYIYPGSPPPFNPPVGAWGAASCASLGGSLSTPCTDIPGDTTWYINILFVGINGLPPLPPSTLDISVLLYYEPPEATFGCTDCSGVANLATATPLPAAAPLFATGLGALGLFGWRRKRRNALAVAA